MSFPAGLVVDAVFIGQVAELVPGRPPSAIAKARVDGPLWLGRTGLEGDEQADLAVHGGPEKALHHYAAEHYAVWRRELPELADRLVPGAFGENISTTGLTEENLCPGDVLRIGSARVQVAQGRQPCWKLCARTGQADMALRFQATGRTGWYYRVVEEGALCAGDAIVLEARPLPDWTLARLIAARFECHLEPAVARELAETEELSASWRKAFARKADPAFVEDTRARLSGV